MSRTWLAIMTILVVALVGAAACGGGAEAAPGSAAGTGGAEPAVGSGSGSGEGSGAAVGGSGGAGSGGGPDSGSAVAGQPAAVPGLPLAAPAARGGGEVGIVVSGTGKVTAKADLARLRLGVETRADSANAAREQAASAMQRVVTALDDRGIAPEDVQTRVFRVRPEYVYEEVVEDGSRRRERRLVGYVVTNTATVEVRDLDALGEVIDEVARAAGNAIRIDGLSFSVEDPSTLKAQAREKAVREALAKARQFAELTGVSVGQLLFISEQGDSTPVRREVALKAEVAAPQPAPQTPISGGELEVRASVRARFAIE